MDHAGYDAVWLAEHHFTTYSVCPSVHLMALEAAHRTRRIRIGTAVSLGLAKGSGSRAMVSPACHVTPRSSL